MQGIININKPKGMTSHDVVSRVRRLFGTRQVGYTGTLDPDAEGVLPILLGGATKLSELLTAEKKSYVARVQLGVATDTYDLSGTVTERRKTCVSEEEICQAVRHFVGKIEQVPPMYSAIKIDGKKLYQLARSGVEVERPARRIEIYALECADFDLAAQQFSLRVDCSKGTYIRSLCHDIGVRLGCGAAMAGLVRTRSGSFRIEDAHTLEELAEAVRSGEAERLLIPVDAALADYPAVSVSEWYAEKIRNGLRLRTEQLGLASAREGERYRLYGAGELLCLASVIRDGGGDLVMKLDKTFFRR